MLPPAIAVVVEVVEVAEVAGGKVGYGRGVGARAKAEEGTKKTGLKALC